MRIQLTGLGAVLALAACSGGGADNAAAANNLAQAPSSEAQQRVRAMPESERNTELIRAIRAARLDCENVQGSLLSETSRNVPVYLATCDDGAVYAVAIASDGTSSVKPVTPAERRSE